MTFQDLYNIVETKIGDTIDSPEKFLTFFLQIQLDLNTFLSAKYNLVKPATTSMNDDITEITGMDMKFYTILSDGIAWAIQLAEQEANALNFQNDYVRGKGTARNYVSKEWLNDRKWYESKTNHCHNGIKILKRGN